MTIEDLIITLSMSTIKFSTFDNTFIHTVAEQISSGKAFTEKQSQVAIRIIRTYNTELSAFLNVDVNQYITNPTYRLPIRVLATHKRISIIHTNAVQKIKVEFAFNEGYINLIKRNKISLSNPVWDTLDKSWKFELNEYVICFLASFAEAEQFQTDAEFKTYADQAGVVLSRIEDYAPMLVIEDDVLQLTNVVDTIPKINTNNILEAVFTARRYGITTWDDSVANYIRSDKVNPHITAFLTNDSEFKTLINSTSVPISCLTDLILYMSPCLVVIPGGSELAKLTLVHDFLKTIGINNSEMSVMFRLPSKTGKLFNDTVKEMKLNNPIDSTTKVVFISGKLPKPVLQSKIYFNCVINLGFGGAHFSTKNYLLSHQNLIYFSEQSPQLEIKYDYM